MRTLFRFFLLLVAFWVGGCYTWLNAQTKPQFPVTLQLDPGPDNPRNSEGDFITLKDGRILFVYTHYTGRSTSDHAPAYLAGRFSADGGKTWTRHDTVVVEKEGDMNVMSVSLLRLANGTIALFYLKKNSEQDCIPQVRFSTDEAKTWSKPMACITDKPGYFVLNNNRVIQLKSGRLLMPVALHRIPGGSWHDKATLYTYFSDDNGVSWKPGRAVPNHHNLITQEPGLVELKNEAILMFVRASGGRQQYAYSHDKGQTWSQLEPSTLTSPLSPASIARLPATGDLLAVWNNNDEQTPATRDKRTPLTIAISKDEGKSWQHIRTIEADPDGWYCYTAIHMVGKKDILLAYCAGSQAKNTQLSVTRIRRLPQAALYP